MKAKIIITMLEYIINTIHEIKTLLTPLKREVLMDIPYFAQDPHIEGQMSTFKFWYKLENKAGKSLLLEKIIDSCCGMICLKMILAAIKGQTDLPSVVNLVNDAWDFGVYTILPDGRLSDMLYIPFVKFIKTKFGLNAEVCKILSLRRIKYELARGNYVIVSVHWDIKDKDSTPPRKGGHLVVVTGYSEIKKCLYINNPSGYEGVSQINYEVPYDKFSNFFAYRGIVIFA